MTKEQLEAIKRRAAATSGEWRRELTYPYYVTSGTTIIAETGWGDDKGENAEFIAHARTDVPTLVAEVEKLRGLLEECDTQLSSAYDELEYCQIANQSQRLKSLQAKIREVLVEE